MKGMVYLVGAGPGDIGLLTLRGAELLGRAEVVVYDGLVNPALLQLAPPGAEIVYGGKHDRTRAVSQEKIDALLVVRAREGKCVVRLKGGDPYVLGRGGEEAEKLAEAGIAFEVVPGVSSAVAVPNYAGIPLTHRGYCSCYTVVTGHESLSGDKAPLDWARLARIPGTLVVLMGVKRLRGIAGSLLAHGRSPDTPVALIRWGTTGRQQVLQGTLATIADAAERARFAPPAIAVIGEVVKLRPKLTWFEKRPLLGQRIVVTQPRGQAAELCRLLRGNGAEVMEIPAMRFAEATDRQPLLRSLENLNTYDWIILSSPTSVDFFFAEFFKRHTDWRDLGPAHLGAYGPQTAARLKALHLRVDATPQEHVGSSIAAALCQAGPLQGRRVLLLRPEGAGPKVPDCLRAMGALVEEVACYRSVGDPEDVTRAAAQLREGGADWITFAGYPEVRFFHARFELGKLVKRFPHLKFATIGPKTSGLLRELGLAPAAQAAQPTPAALAQALVQAVSGEAVS
jgi:uroporphyrinogen III methyltransferase/synthase